MLPFPDVRAFQPTLQAHPRITPFRQKRSPGTVQELRFTRGIPLTIDFPKLILLEFPTHPGNQTRPRCTSAQWAVYVMGLPLWARGFLSRGVGRARGAQRLSRGSGLRRFAFRPPFESFAPRLWDRRRICEGWVQRSLPSGALFLFFFASGRVPRKRMPPFFPMEIHWASE